MIELLSDPNVWLQFGILTLMEIVLGIDNIVFISILTGRVEVERRLFARRLGIGMALISRLVLLGTLNWIMGLEKELFTFIIPWSGRDLILGGGGLFLLYKATHEIYENVEHPEEAHDPTKPASGVPRAAASNLTSIVIQIMLLDIVFSLDSVITAVGMSEHIEVMVAAVVVAVGMMLVFAGPVGDFVQNNPSIRVLALAFLVLIGAMLIMEGTGQHVSKGYIYSAMGFSLFVQVLNIRRDRRRTAKAAAA